MSAPVSSISSFLAPDASVGTVRLMSVVLCVPMDVPQLIFLGDASNRNKINLIIANEITPHLSAEEYMDKGEYENELRQVIGDTKAAYDIR